MVRRPSLLGPGLAWMAVHPQPTSSPEGKNIKAVPAWHSGRPSGCRLDHTRCSTASAMQLISLPPGATAQVSRPLTLSRHRLLDRPSVPMSHAQQQGPRMPGSVAHVPTTCLSCIWSLQLPRVVTVKQTLAEGRPSRLRTGIRVGMSVRYRLNLQRNVLIKQTLRDTFTPALMPIPVFRAALYRYTQEVWRPAFCARLLPNSLVRYALWSGKNALHQADGGASCPQSNNIRRARHGQREVSR